MAGGIKMRKMRFLDRKIKGKIKLAIVACSVIMTLLVGGVSIFNSSRIIKQEATKNLSLIAENKVKEFDSIITNVESSGNGLAAIINSTLDAGKMSTDKNYLKDYQDRIENIVKGFGESTEGAMSVYFYANPDLTKEVYGSWFADEKNDGTLTSQPLGELQDFTPDNKDMEWYYKPINAKKALWLDPYVDPDLNISMISYVVPIYKNDVLIGVAGMDVRFDRFEQVIKSTHIYDTGNVALVNQNFDFLVLPEIKHNSNIGFIEKIKSKYFDKKVENTNGNASTDTVAQASQNSENANASKGNFADMNGGSLKYLTEEMSKNNSGIIEYRYEKLDKILAYEHLSNGYIMLIDVPQVEVLREMNDIVFKVILLILGGIALSLIVAEFVGRIIGNPIIRVTKLVDKTAKLDLTEDESVEGLLKREDEVGLIAKSVENMRGFLRGTVEDIMKGAANIADHSNHLADAMNETTASMYEIAMTTNELAAGATQQAGVAQEGLSKLVYLANEIKNIADNSNSVKNYIDEADRVNKQALVSVENLQHQFKNNNDITQEITESIELLASRSESISNIVTAINYVAKQTNLLALNAAIEAARAGEAGRGFAVVAEEIRKLSEQTSSSTANIESIIDGIKVDISETKDKMDSANKIVEQSNKALSATSKSFEVIEEAMKNIFNQINSLIESIEKMDGNKNDVVLSIKEISSITEESVASTEEVSTTVENQSTTIGEVSKTTENLKEIALNLEKLIGQFKIN